MGDKTETTILLDIYERLGAIETKLEHVEKLENKVNELEEFKSKVAAYIWLGGSVASGVLFFLWKGLEFAADKIWHH